MQHWLISWGQKYHSLLFPIISFTFPILASLQRIPRSWGAGKLLTERRKIWVKQAGDEKNITLLSSDYSYSIDQWNVFDQQKRDVVLEIGDTILEELLKEFVIEEN